MAMDTKESPLLGLIHKEVRHGFDTEGSSREVR
jgi:hypothetical protein